MALPFAADACLVASSFEADADEADDAAELADDAAAVFEDSALVSDAFAFVSDARSGLVINLPGSQFYRQYILNPQNYRQS